MQGGMDKLLCPCHPYIEFDFKGITPSDENKKPGYPLYSCSFAKDLYCLANVQNILEKTLGFFKNHLIDSPAFRNSRRPTILIVAISQFNHFATCVSVA